METKRSSEQLNILNQLSKYLDLEIHYYKKLLMNSQKAEMNREISKIEDFLKTISSEIKWNYHNDVLIQQILEHYKSITSNIRIISDFIGEKDENLGEFDEFYNFSEKCQSKIIGEIKNMLHTGEDERALFERFNCSEVRKSSEFLFDFYLELLLRATYSDYILQVKKDIHYELKNAFENLSDEDLQSFFNDNNIFGDDTRLKYNDTILKRYSIDADKWDFYQLITDKKPELSLQKNNELENFLNWIELNQDSIYSCLKSYILNLMLADLLLRPQTPNIDDLSLDQIKFLDLVNTSTIISGSLADL